MSNYTTPEDLQDDMYDSKYDPDSQFLPDDGKYEAEITFATIDPKKPFTRADGSQGEIGSRYRLILKILNGPTQQSGASAIGKTFFGAEATIPGGEWDNPKYELYGDYTSIDAVKTAAVQQFRRFLDSIGWTREHGGLYRTDPKVFVGLKTVEGASVTVQQYDDKKGERRCRVFWNPPKKASHG